MKTNLLDLYAIGQLNKSENLIHDEGFLLAHDLIVQDYDTEHLKKNELNFQIVLMLMHSLTLMLI
jgi:hypothetical protein